MKRLLNTLKSIFGRSEEQIKNKAAEVKRRQWVHSKKTLLSRAWPKRQEKHKGPKI